MDEYYGVYDDGGKKWTKKAFHATTGHKKAITFSGSQDITNLSDLELVATCENDSTQAWAIGSSNKQQKFYTFCNDFDGEFTVNEFKYREDFEVKKTIAAGGIAVSWIKLNRKG